MNPAVFRLMCVLAVLALAGCATPEAPFVAERSTRSEVYWRTGSGVLVFEGVFAKGRDGAGVLQLFKGGPSPVLVLRLSHNGRARAGGPLSRKGWSGDRADCPAFLAPGFALLDIYLAGNRLPEGDREIHAPRVRAAADVRDGRLVRASASSNETSSAIGVRFLE